ncbi:MAG TPA: hypothetical protein VE053_13440 [Allosphingosinicella sp.]|nr:hypothetical protein [Allosphingosinicella sp.]
MSIKMILASTAALAMVAGTPAFAAKDQDRQVAAAEAGGAGAKKICRTFSNTVSRVKREKLCLTKAEWKKFEQDQL